MFDRESLVLAHLVSDSVSDVDGSSLSDLLNALGVASDRVSDRIELVTTLDDLRSRGLIESTAADHACADKNAFRFRLTKAGRERAKQLRSELLATTIEFVDGDREQLSIQTAATRLNRPPVAIAAELTADGVYYRQDTPDQGFLGRSRALETTDELFDTVQHGDGRALLVSGPPGVGKTTLAEEVLDHARDAGLDVLQTRARSEGTTAYGPLRNLVGDLDGDPFSDAGPSVDEPEAAQAQRTALFADLTELIAPGPSDSARVVYVDDLHLADRGTLSYLAHLFTELSTHRLLILGSFRPTELSENAPIAPEHVEASSVTYLELPPFDSQQTEALIRQLLGTRGLPSEFVEAVHERTGGNPLFVEVLVDALLEREQVDPTLDMYPDSPTAMDVPGEVREMLKRRIRQFPDPARDLLRWAAILGEQFDLDLFRTVTDAPDAQFQTYLESFIDGAVFDRTDDQLAFRSEVLREALLDELAVDERRQRHEVVTTELERREDSDPAAAAYHLRRAGDLDEAIDAYRSAAEDAVDIYAHETALDHLEVALEIARDRDDSETLVEIATDIASVNETLGEYEDAEQFAEFARQEAPTDETRGRALAHLANVATGQGDHDRAIDLAEEGLAVVAEDSRTACRLLGTKAAAQAAQSDYSQARETATRQRTLATELGASDLEAKGLRMLGRTAIRQSALEDARDYFEQSLAIVQEIGDRQGEARTLMSLGVIPQRKGAYDQAREYCEQGLAIYREIGDRYGEADSLNNLGVVAFQQGAFEDASEYYEQSLEINREIGDRDGEAASLGNLSLIAFEQGAYEKARKYREHDLEIKRETGNRHGEAISLSNLGDIDVEQGRYEQGREYYEQSLSIYRDVGDRQGEAYSLLGLGDVARRQGDDKEAHEYLKQSRKIARELEELSLEVSVLATIGTIECDRGDYEDAQEHIDRALDLAKTLESQSEVAESQLAAGRLALAHGNFEAARNRGQQARQTFEETGATHWVGRARRLLGRVAERSGEPDLARDHWRAAIDIFETVGAPQDILETMEHLVECCREQGDDDRADDWLERAQDVLADAPDATTALHREWVQR